MQIMSKSWRAVAAAALLLAGASQMAPAQAQTQATFADPAFQRTWERTDKPVADHQADRSWYWGPTPGFATQEPYKQGQGGSRLVQYFDKSRMEINNPGGDKNSAFYVTNGLLAVELMTGRMQVGDSEFETRCAAEVPLASDTDDANAPTYATFGKLMNEPKANKVGQPAVSTVDRAGTVSVNSVMASQPGVNVVYYDNTTGRNVPKVFWDFLNQSGPIYSNGQLGNGPLNQPWFFASGLPLTEAYWANVKVAGKQTDVLIQAFERRILTYIPAYNGTPFAVQMGNVGQHYYNWRYKGEGCTGTGGGGSTPTPKPNTPPTNTPAPAACDAPASQSATVQPSCGPVGTVFRIHVTGFQPGEQISLWYTAPNGQVVGTPRPLDAGNHPGELDDEFDSTGMPSSYFGNWAVTYQGATSGHKSVAWFKVTAGQAGGGGGGAPTATPAPVSCDLNATKDASVSPTSGKLGTVFSITVRGFQGNEDASYWITDPDGVVFGSQEHLTIPSSGTGTLRFNSGVLPYPGTWSLTVHGLSSNHESIAVFCVTP